MAALGIALLTVGLCLGILCWRVWEQEQHVLRLSSRLTTSCPAQTPEKRADLSYAETSVQPLSFEHFDQMNEDATELYPDASNPFTELRSAILEQRGHLLSLEKAVRRIQAVQAELHHSVAHLGNASLSEPLHEPSETMREAEQWVAAPRQWRDGLLVASLLLHFGWLLQLFYPKRVLPSKLPGETLLTHRASFEGFVDPAIGAPCARHLKNEGLDAPLDAAFEADDISSDAFHALDDNAEALVLLRRRSIPLTGDAEHDCTEWIESLLECSRGDVSFHTWLRDGRILCQVANVISPGIIPDVHDSVEPFRQMENIGLFLRACRSLQILEKELFATVDLFEAKNMQGVHTCIFSLARRAASLPDFQGPLLGSSSAPCPRMAPKGLLASPERERPSPQRSES